MVIPKLVSNSLNFRNYENLHLRILLVIYDWNEMFFTNTVKPALAVTCIKRSPFSCPVIEKFIWIKPLLTGHLSYKAIFLSPKAQRWPLNTGLDVLLVICNLHEIFLQNNHIRKSIHVVKININICALLHIGKKAQTYMYYYKVLVSL